MAQRAVSKTHSLSLSLSLSLFRSLSLSVCFAKDTPKKCQNSYNPLKGVLMPSRSNNFSTFNFNFSPSLSLLLYLLLLLSCHLVPCAFHMNEFSICFSALSWQRTQRATCNMRPAIQCGT